MCLCAWREEEEEIITKSARSSVESRVFEQRRESSPVVESCERIEEIKPQKQRDEYQSLDEL